MRMSIRKLLLATALVAAPLAAHADAFGSVFNDDTPFKMILGFDFHTVPLTGAAGPEGPDFRDWNYIDSASMAVGPIGGNFGGCPNFQPQYYKQNAITMTFHLLADTANVRLTFTEASNHNFGGDYQYNVFVLLDGKNIRSRLDDPQHAGGYYSIIFPLLSAGTHTISWKLGGVNGVPITAPGDYFNVCFPALSIF